VTVTCCQRFATIELSSSLEVPMARSHAAKLWLVAILACICGGTITVAISCVRAGFGTFAQAGSDSSVASDAATPGGGALPYLGQVMLFAGNFAPKGWAMCDGTLLPIAQHKELFQILGTTYGGDGTATFGLHAGAGPGMAARKLGQKGGIEQVTLTGPQLPSHKHALMASTKAASAGDPQAAVLANSTENIYQSSTSGLFAMAGEAVANTGSGQAHTNMPPFLALSFIIALEGTTPQRN
jgi:microcystin-dependent protein